MAADDWLARAAAAPEQGVALLGAHLAQAPEVLQGWVHGAFLQGYQAVMLFLAASVLLVWASVALLRAQVAAPAEAAAEQEPSHGKA